MQAAHAADKHHQPGQDSKNNHRSEIRLSENTDGQHAEDQGMGQESDGKLLEFPLFFFQ